MNNPFEVIDARLSNIETLLLDLKHKTGQKVESSELDKLFTINEAADFLNLKNPTIYSLVSRGELPVMKRSKRLYFSKLELINYLKQGRNKTNSEVESEAQQFLKSKSGR